MNGLDVYADEDPASPELHRKNDTNDNASGDSSSNATEFITPGTSAMSRTEDKFANLVIRKPPRKSSRPAVTRSSGELGAPSLKVNDSADITENESGVQVDVQDGAGSSYEGNGQLDDKGNTAHTNVGQPAEQNGGEPGFDQLDEITRIRTLLRPPDTYDWASTLPPIPSPSDVGTSSSSSSATSAWIPPSPTLTAKLTQFAQLKTSPNPKHFNDSLMSSRAFRNPHLYAQLVDFVDVDEGTSCFPSGVGWEVVGLNMGMDNGLKEEWFAENIAEEQKKREEARSASQAPNKRQRIDFTSSSTSTQARGRGSLSGPSASRSSRFSRQDQNGPSVYGPSIFR